MSRHTPQEAQDLAPEQALLIAILQRARLDCHLPVQQRAARAFLRDPDGAQVLAELLGLDGAATRPLLLEAAA